MNKNISNEIITILEEIIPNPVCELDYNNPFELLIATILSQQTKDKRVNEVTKVLFSKYPNPESLMNAQIDEVEKIIAPVGLGKMKSKNIIMASKDLYYKYNSIVPSNLDDLMLLSGVGRKTASVVLAEAFKIPAVPVDTHVLRVSNRLGYAKSDNPLVVEEALKKYIPKDKWILSHHLFIHFGRYKCLSKNHMCSECKLKNYCKEKNKNL